MLGDEVEGRIREIGNLIEALQRETKSTLQETSVIDDVLQKYEIVGGYGSVGVDRFARLREIRLNKEVTNGCSPSTFAAALVDAINTAEKRVCEELVTHESEK
ncbi:hypothetical protein GCM10010182_56740 [Actinomadura cremea]|nr:hypothetical protein GCM10010182_56740 [Actinomadura cremea]